MSKGPGRRRADFALAVLLSLGIAPACSALRPYGVTPAGLARSDARARSLLRSGRADSLALLVQDGVVDPGDDLLRLLYGGVAAHHAGNYVAALDLFERASIMTEDRVTKSVSRAALSVVTNDRVLPYVPARTERLLIPYYAALGYLRRGETLEAVVEARRLSNLLDREPAAGPSVARLDALLGYFAATIFEAGGETNDAAVAYRRAAALAPEFVEAVDTLATELEERGLGEVIIIAEIGYAPVLVEESLYAWIDGGELRGLTEGDADGRAGLATLIAGRLASGDLDSPRRAALERERGNGTGRATGCGTPPGSTPPDTSVARADCDADGQADDDEAGDDSTPYLLKLAWPALRSTDAPATDIEARSDGISAVGRVASVAAGVEHDFDGQRAWLLARAVFRSAAKLAIAKAAEKEVSEKDETAGTIVGVLANAGSILLEHADTRSWSLLPGTLSIARLRLQPGEHDIRVSAAGRTVQRRVLIEAGRPTFLDIRIW